MQHSSVLIKTPKGLEEIDKRTHKLQGRLRAILFMVDGQRTFSDLLEQAGSLASQLEGQLEELASQGFVAEVVSEVPATEPPPTPAPPPPAPPTKRAAPPTKASTPPQPARPAPPKAVEPIAVLKQRLSKMLTETMGMRAMFLAAQLESLNSQSELSAFIDDTARSLATSNGPKPAEAWRDRARTLIGL